MATPHPKLTYDDYVLFPDDGRRRQLIDGKVYVSPSPNARHQDTAGFVYVSFWNHLRAHGGGRVFQAPFDVLLSRSDVVQPDVVFVGEDRTGVITDANIQGTPSLAIEVVSDPTLDKRVKRDLYARFEVPEYWVVDPDLDRVEVYRHGKTGYGKPEILEPGDTLTTPLLPGLAIDLTDLFRR
jgi:Uma2 family endonuclease